MSLRRERELAAKLKLKEAAFKRYESMLAKKDAAMERQDAEAAVAMTALLHKLHAAAEKMQCEHEEENNGMASKVAELEKELERKNRELTRAVEKCLEFRAELGIEAGRSIPSRRDGVDTNTLGKDAAWKHSSRQMLFIKNAIKERDPSIIASAIASAGGEELLFELAKTQHFQPLIYKITSEAAKFIQDRWNARHSLHIMSDLSLSRELFEMLRHLLSFEYIPPVGEREEDNMPDNNGNEKGDYYERLHIYENPFNKRQRVEFPALQPRLVREAERDAVLGTLENEQSECGGVAYRKNLVAAVEGMAGMYWSTGVLRRGVTEGTEKLLLVGFGDATGGWNSDSVTHFEVAVGSLKTISQSKVTLLNALLCEGKDDAKTLRTKAQPFTEQLTKLHEEGMINIFPPTDAAVQVAQKVQVRVLFAGDFQIIKAFNNMSSYTSPIWCECEDINTFSPTTKRTWKDVLKWYNDCKCVVKTLQRICELNGWSYAKLMGKPFEPFDCGCACAKQHSWRTEAEWRRWVKANQALEGAALKEANRIWGGQHRRHWPSHPPCHKFPSMLHFSVDILHALFINYFKMIAEMTLFCYYLESKPAYCL